MNCASDRHRPLDKQADHQRRQSYDEYGQCQDHADFEIVAPTYVHALLVQDVQPQKRGQRPDRRHLWPQIATDDVGVHHGVADDARRRRRLDRQRADQDGRQVVGDGRQEGGQEARPKSRAPNPTLREPVQQACDCFGQASIPRAVDDQMALSAQTVCP